MLMNAYQSKNKKYNFTYDCCIYCSHYMQNTSLIYSNISSILKHTFVLFPYFLTKY